MRPGTSSLARASGWCEFPRRPHRHAQFPVRGMNEPVDLPQGDGHARLGRGRQPAAQSEVGRRDRHQPGLRPPAVRPPPSAPAAIGDRWYDPCRARPGLQPCKRNLAFLAVRAGVHENDHLRVGERLGQFGRQLVDGQPTTPAVPSRPPGGPRTARRRRRRAARCRNRSPGSGVIARRTSSRTVPSGPISCTCSGICADGVRRAAQARVEGADAGLHAVQHALRDLSARGCSVGRSAPPCGSSPGCSAPWR